jgi:programmed cell death 6-interacting protein
MRIDTCRLATANDAAKEAILKYLQQIEWVKDKLPVSDTQITVRFAWDDSFSGKSITGIADWKYERLCLLFNLAALESQVGASVSRTTKEGIKEAARHFQTAAGILFFLRDSMLDKILGKMPSDLSHHSLTFLGTVMLAQAQLCFYEMAANHLGYPPEKISRIAIKSADLYRDSLKALTPELSKELNKVYPYEKHIEVQSACLDAIAYLNEAKVYRAK